MVLPEQFYIMVINADSEKQRVSWAPQRTLGRRGTAGREHASTALSSERGHGKGLPAGFTSPQLSSYFYYLSGRKGDVSKAKLLTTLMMLFYQWQLVHEHGSVITVCRNSVSNCQENNNDCRRISLGFGKDDGAFD